MTQISHPNFISIEGVDGAGKSTHVAKIIQQLRQAGYDVVHAREPGGTVLGEQLRQLALHAPMHPTTETMIMFASRNELLETIIRPALAAGSIVVCDRFTDSTWAYQGGGRGVPEAILASQEKLVHGDLQPGLTLLFDLPVEISLQRLALTGKIPDKFEAQDYSFHDKVRKAYLKRAVDTRFKIIDSSKSVENIAEQVDLVLARHAPNISAEKSPQRSPAPRA